MCIRDSGDTVPDLYDEFDRCAKNFYADKPEDEDAAKYFEASIVRDHFRQSNFMPRFRTLSVLIQMPSLDIYAWAKQEKGSDLTPEEKEILDERIKYAKVWLKLYAPEKYLFMFSETLPESVKDLTPSQKDFLKNVIEMVQQNYLNKEKTADELQYDIFELSKKLGIASKEAFSSIYIALIGKAFGPKAGWLIKDIGYPKVIERFRAAAE
jgi:lysyl-tRNA synthetase class 1